MCIMISAVSVWIKILNVLDGLGMLVDIALC